MKFEIVPIVDGKGRRLFAVRDFESAQNDESVWLTNRQSSDYFLPQRGWFFTGSKAEAVLFGSKHKAKKAAVLYVEESSKARAWQTAESEVFEIP